MTIFTNKPLRRTLRTLYEDIERYVEGVPEDIGEQVEALEETVSNLSDSVDELETEVVKGIAAVTSVQAFKATLNGNAYTPINFTAATAASLAADNAEPYDLTGVGDGGTIIVTPDGGEAQTATINFAAGTSVSGASPSTDISGETDTKFMISVDGDEAEEVTLTVSGKNTGELIAAEMQTQIQALGGNKASVTVAFDAVYTITSPTLGTSSAIVITPADSGSLTEELKIGVADGGTETVGTGDVADASEATAAEIAAVCDADMVGIAATAVGGAVVLTSSGDAGKDNKLVVGAGTLNAVIGFTESEETYGAQSAGFDAAMNDANYFVTATLNGASTLTSRVLSVTDRTANGFNLRCETAAATDDVDIVVFGVKAAS